MNRRNLITGAAVAAAVAAVGGGGFMAWASAGGSEWQMATESLRRPLDPAGGIAELVRYATLAANSHNAQPWQFAVGERSIAILPDFARSTPVVDPDDHHLFASIGCAAENIVQAAALSGSQRRQSSARPGTMPLSSISRPAPPRQTNWRLWWLAARWRVSRYAAAAWASCL